jgi:hypothetical protein
MKSSKKISGVIKTAAKWLGDTFDKTWEIAQIVGIIAYAFIVLAFFAKIFLAPIAPLVTAMFVLYGTYITFAKRTTAIMSIGGIVLYITSWLVVNSWGIWPAQLFCMAGMLAWFTAIIFSFQYGIQEPQPIKC